MMSQKLHTCANNINMDTIQCEAYASKLIQKDKLRSNPKAVHTKLLRENFSTSRAVTSTMLARNAPSKLRSDTMRKDVFADNAAMVEVTVKTHKARSRSSSSHNEPWGRVLKASDENASSFHNFDPLRTVHFLAKELQSKLRSTLPNDTNIQQMIAEIQHALNRVPTEIAELDRCDTKPIKLVANKCLTDGSSKPKSASRDAIIQTPPGFYIEPEQFQQHLEENTQKIESACHQMEQLMAKLKSEKDQVEVLLATEKETVKVLNRQIDDYKYKLGTSNSLVQTLQEKCETLEIESRKLQIQLDNLQGPAAQDLRCLIEELQKQKSDAQEECAILKQQLTLASMESEKYEAILQARDSQVKEIRNEMSQLQEVVNQQLLDLQNNPYSSDGSSVSGKPSIWSGTASKDNPENNIERDYSTLSSINSNDSRLQEIITNVKTATQVKRVNSGETSTSEDVLASRKIVPQVRSPRTRTSKKKHEVASKTATNVRNKIVEIKKKALSCNEPTATVQHS